MTPSRTEVAPAAASPAAVAPAAASPADDRSRDMVNEKTVKPEGVEQNAPPRSLLGQLLHALNQPLTGLQCSMEVALARPRTVEQHVQGLHDGLELTERMRDLVGAIREITEIEEAQSAQLTTGLTTSELQTRKLPASEWGTVELESVLQGAAEELRPVAAGKNVRITLARSTPLPASSLSSLAAPGEQSALGRVIFRLLDATVSLAACGTTLRIETCSKKKKIELQMNWHTEAPASTYSRPELGLMIVQACLQRAGAEWKREETDGVETLTVRLPSGRSA